MSESIELKHLFTIFHFLGIIIGMGGALMSDAIFFSSISDEKVSHTEMRFLRLGGRVVWLGLIIAIISGVLLFSLNPEKYWASSKFLAKMTIVIVIALNGFLFHIIHIPRLHRHIGHHFPSSDEFMRMAPLLIASGAVSVISWAFALILGSLRSLPYSYASIMIVYIATLFISIVIATSLKRILIPHPRKRT